MLEINTKLPSTLYGITPEWVRENKFVTTRDKGLLLLSFGIVILCIAGIISCIK